MISKNVKSIVDFNDLFRGTGMVEKALKNKKLGKKTVSFDKSISYSDDTQPSGILVTNKKHNHNHGYNHNPTQDVDLYHNLKRLQKSARELKQEVRVLRRLTQLQSMAMKDLVQDTYIKVSPKYLITKVDFCYKGV